MIKHIALTFVVLLAGSLPAWAHDAPVEHMHSGGLTIYAVPAIAALAVAVVVGFVAWTGRTGKNGG